MIDGNINFVALSFMIYLSSSIGIVLREVGILNQKGIGDLIHSVTDLESNFGTLPKKWRSGAKRGGN
jgi:molybdate-binding protein